jgi:archaellum component FlaC
MMEDISNRVTALETKVEAVMESQEKIDGKLDMIMENHLHHLELDVQSIKTAIQMYSKIMIAILTIPSVIFTIMQILKAIKG